MDRPADQVVNSFYDIFFYVTFVYVISSSLSSMFSLVPFLMSFIATWYHFYIYSEAFLFSSQYLLLNINGSQMRRNIVQCETGQPTSCLHSGCLFTPVLPKYLFIAQFTIFLLRTRMQTSHFMGYSCCQLWTSATSEEPAIRCRRRGIRCKVSWACALFFHIMWLT